MKRGFTLIELLIVIAIFGILAAAVLAAIDPLQQIKKGRDSAIRNLMIEYSNALLRYNAVQGGFPWATTHGIGKGATLPGTGATLNGLNVTAALIDTGELKTKFVELAGTPNLTRVFIVGTTTTATLCFQPESKAERANPQARFNSTGGDQTGCPNGASATCHICNTVE